MTSQGGFMTIYKRKVKNNIYKISVMSNWSPNGHLYRAT